MKINYFFMGRKEIGEKGSGLCMIFEVSLDFIFFVCSLLIP